MKKIKSLCLVAILILISGKNTNAMTFSQAREQALNSSQQIKLQDEIISSVEKKYEKQKEDPFQNNPDYIYSGMTKIPVYNHTYPTYDYEEILKNQKDKKRDMVIANENKTLKLFIDILQTNQDIKDSKKQINQQEIILNQTKAKYKNGQVIKLDVQNQENILKQKHDRLKTLENTLKVQERRFNQHLNLKLDKQVQLELIEPDLDIQVPKDISEKSIDNIKQYKDLKKELDDLNDDMKWIKEISAQYYIDKQQEKIDDIKDDIKEYKRQNEYNYTKIYDNIKVKLNSLKSKKISLKQLKRQKQTYTEFFKQGLITKNKIEDTEILIQQNLISQTKLTLEIKQLLQNYYQEIREI